MQLLAQQQHAVSCLLLTTAPISLTGGASALEEGRSWEGGLGGWDTWGRGSYSRTMANAWADRAGHVAAQSRTASTGSWGAQFPCC
jgi:hypothetical protein